jgi:transcriptional regulator with XRE-family HTH domain
MAEALKYWRAKKGFSQTRLAELANTSALTISQLESGKRKGRGKTLEKILNGFKLGREEFFSMRGDAASAAVPVEDTLSGESSKAMSTRREGANLRLSNLDLELLNRILNLDFESKLETLRFLQNLS